MMRKALGVMLMMTLAFGCTPSYLKEGRSQQRKGSAPAVLDYYAAPELRPGDDWKIFLRARDEDGDMKYIAAGLYQAGVGYYRVNFTPVKAADRSEFAGYLLLKIPPDQSFFGDRFDMMVLVRDQQGYRSAAVNMPLSIGNRPPEALPDKWQTAADNLLEMLLIDLESSFFYNRGDGDSRPEH